MRKKIPKIKEFPDDGRIWRVDWFGGVERNEQVPSEPKIQLIISPVVDESDFAASRAVNHAERQVISIGVGQLPLVTIGSLWQNRRRLISTAGRTTLFNNLEISPEKVRVIKSDAIIDGTPLIPKRYHQIGTGLSAKCLAVEWQGDHYGIIIPVAEIIRFYYATSTDLAKAIFFGDFRHNLTAIVNPAECGFNPVERQCILKLRKEFSDSDAFIIGRILNSPEALASVHLVHDSLLKYAVQGKSRAYPESNFPFSGITNLRVRLKPIPTSEDKKWRYIVFALEHCTGHFPFDSIICDRDNSNLRPEDGDDLPREQKEAAYSVKPRDKPETVDSELQSDNEPSRDIQQVNLDSPEDRFGVLADMELEKPQKEICHYFNAGTIHPLSEPTNALGTGDGTYAESDVTPLSIETTHVRQVALPASFDTFEAMVRHLNNKPGFQATIRSRQIPIEFIPLTKSRRSRQWSYLDSELQQRRIVVIADIAHQSERYCLVEFQWREGESYKLALISSPSCFRISNELMLLVLRAMAKAQGRWENAMPLPANILLSTLKHTWPSIESYTIAIQSKIEEMIKL
ncbi:hypothetical protein [Methylomonas koyamae]|uniref:hypothetical protein n=1 Tax=Methylomonas koyamae TaxID=702114 RepID=UPI0028732E18|nr:hypothetical protein [Methylomonas koyamae]WNB77187.1 hypothetical protein RI210_06340 [Methylomonas koyamae]